ncbi:MAG: hypothetical protein ACREX3_12220 [Gammaproteobacteria bacterium]
MHYDAFITYHRLSDEARAMALERALKRFAKPLFKLRALEIFRDDAALAANPSLWSAISQALDSAGHLILVASPGAASSPWVGREVAHWLARKSSDGLMIVLSDGDIRWDRSAGDFDWATTTALPETMRTRFGDEPRWIDFRWAREDADLTLDNPRFVATVAELAAPMHGKPKDTLIGEDVSQHRRLNRLTRLAAGSLLLLVVGLSVSLVYALLQRDEAKGRQLALEAEAIQRDLTGSIASERAAALAIEGWRRQPSHVAYEAAAIALTETPRLAPSGRVRRRLDCLPARWQACRSRRRPQPVGLERRPEPRAVPKDAGSLRDGGGHQPRWRALGGRGVREPRPRLWGRRRRGATETRTRTARREPRLQPER